MIHRCPRCAAILRGVITRLHWAEHKVCVPCQRVFVCWGELLTGCETPLQCAPLPWRFRGPSAHAAHGVQPGPHSRGLL